jgi:hypothetical protein
MNACCERKPDPLEPRQGSSFFDDASGLALFHTFRYVALAACGSVRIFKLSIRPTGGRPAVACEPRWTRLAGSRKNTLWKAEAGPFRSTVVSAHQP